MEIIKPITPGSPSHKPFFERPSKGQDEKKQEGPDTQKEGTATDPKPRPEISEKEKAKALAAKEKEQELQAALLRNKILKGN
ncbi:MAG: hypothetical protein KGI50_03450 [Patescibacteria group bacterium]|nr:hypothetical protein [Patescibacteria group bacterium]MDE2438347.1 hypothetical protein [Patescibacteria group bacterium]